MRLAFIRCIIPMLLILGGCEPSWRAQFPNGSRLYDKTDHRLFGKVVGFESRHDFHNGTPPAPAILIQEAGDEQTPQWGSCATCAVTFQIETP